MEKIQLTQEEYMFTQKVNKKFINIPKITNFEFKTLSLEEETFNSNFNLQEIKPNKFLSLVICKQILDIQHFFIQYSAFRKLKVEDFYFVENDIVKVKSFWKNIQFYENIEQDVKDLESLEQIEKLQQIEGNMIEDFKQFIQYLQQEKQYDLNKELLEKVQIMENIQEIKDFLNLQINLLFKETKPEFTNEYYQHLMLEARKVRENAYCFYSNFQVGSVLVDQNYNTHCGVNVENSAYGDTLCGERVAIQSAITRGMNKLLYIVTQADTGTPKNPCGVCRQVINEFGDEDTIIIFSTMEFKYNIYKLSSLMPGYVPNRVPNMLQ